MFIIRLFVCFDQHYKQVIIRKTFLITYVRHYNIILKNGHGRRPEFGSVETGQLFEVVLLVHCWKQSIVACSWFASTFKNALLSWPSTSKIK